MRLRCPSILVLSCLLAALPAWGQSPSALYTWSGTNNLQGWVKNFGTATVVLDNSTSGELRITETNTPAGEDVGLSDGANRIRETPSLGSGGTDLTGLDYLEYDLGHSGTGTIAVQFFVQASPAFNFVALGADHNVAPGVHTYQAPLSGLNSTQAVYVRTMGFNVRDHFSEGNVVWTLREVRAGGTPLASRTLVTHDTGTVEGGLQGAYVYLLDSGAVLGNSGSLNQSGLSHNPTGSGSLQWTDLGGSNGATIVWGNGTALSGNSFNNREADLSNYETMIVRMSASGADTSVVVQGIFLVNNFSLQQSSNRTLEVDGQFHDLEFPMSGLANLNVVDASGINLANHASNLVMNVDSVRFVAPVDITSVVKSGQNVNVTFSAPTGLVLTLERSTNLLGTNWIAVGAITGNGESASTTDNNAAAAALRHYRVRRVP